MCLGLSWKDFYCCISSETYSGLSTVIYGLYSTIVGGRIEKKETRVGEGKSGIVGLKRKGCEGRRSGVIGLKRKKRRGRRPVVG